MIRPEHLSDTNEISALVTRAFLSAEHSSGTEAAIVGALRDAEALTLSLIATDAAGKLIGHIAFSPVTVDGRDCRFYGLGPIAVEPDHQRKGVGRALIEAGISEMRRMGARGIVLLGDPAYYQRFGFANDPALKLEGVPAEYFMALWLGDDPGDAPSGRVGYHPAFGV